jgi:fused signal recognition particle receptor
MLRNLFNRKTENLLEEQQSKVEEATAVPEEQRSWFNRLKTGLAKTRNTIIGQISGLLRVGRTIDEELMEEIEEILIQADVGVNTTLELMDNVREVVRAKGLKDASELGEILKQEMLNVLGEDASVNVDGGQPHTILVLGINGAGKTTTIGKLAHRFRSEGKRVFVAAGDTFRAAAVDQLAIWCDRAGVELIRGGEGADPASVVFDAIEAARSRQVDVLIIDTAGRLHTKKPLMDELSKIGRVMQRASPEAPHEVLFVLDGTAGQNAIMQAKVFNEAVPITGVAVTKLDGTAKGGIVIAVKKEIGAPVRLIGIGEKLDDLRDFVGRDFVEALFEREEVAED